MEKLRMWVLLIKLLPPLREKARMLGAVHGDERPQGFWGHVCPI
jgi:hypothetical protein